VKLDHRHDVGGVVGARDLPARGAAEGLGRVDLEVEGERRPLTAGVELAAYRTLQHALAATGGRDDPATVRLRYLPERLELEVQGSQAGGTIAGAALLAARERVLVLGGKFSADSPSPGHRVVRAWLPAVPFHA
jgi:glucose-6-phosphate-specific signal transduction histidine kinase